MLENIIAIGKADLMNAVFVVMVIVAIWIFKKGIDFYMKAQHDMDTDYAIGELNHSAPGIRRMSCYIAVGIGMSAALIGESNGFKMDAISLCQDAVIIMLAIGITWFINDFFILKGITNTDYIKKNNNAVAIVEAGGIIAAAIVLRGALTGTGPIESTIVFFGLSQLILLLCIKRYIKKTTFDDILEIKNNNPTVGLLFAFEMIALAIILGASAAGNFTSWDKEIPMFLYGAAKGIIGLYIIELVADKYFLPGTDIVQEVEDKNWGAMLVIGSIKIAFALTLACGMV